MRSMQSELVRSGLATKIPVCKPRKGKQFKCSKCGTVMVKHEDENFMYCPACNKPSYFIFDKK